MSMSISKKPALLIIGYYHLADGFKACADFLEKDYTVYFFPLCHYLDHKYNVRSEVLRYIKGEKCDRYECGLIENNPPIDIVLFWNSRYFIDSHNGLDLVVTMKNEIKHKVLYLAYNWDPMPPTGEIDELKMAFIRLLNGYLTCDGREIKYLRDIGQYNYMYCPPGFNPQITNYVNNNDYACDVSIVCTNLYTDYSIFTRNSVRVHRKEMVDLIYQHRNEINFHIYGPKEFKELYPACYKGYIKYEDCPKVFSNSKINLCIHATSYNNFQKYLYYSERLPQIMGSRGLAYCDTEYDQLLLPNTHYILADPSDPWNQIQEILKNYDSSKYQVIKEKAHELANKNMTWDHMRQRINIIAQRTHLNYVQTTRKKT